MAKHFRVMGNWKMNKTIAEAVDFVKSLPPLTTPNFLAVPATCLRALSDLHIPLLKIGAQNIYSQPDGAYTGEISSTQVKEAGAEFVIVGHSERRQIFQENNEFINKKVKQLLLDDLYPVLCIGETLIERDENRTDEVLKSQLYECLEGVDAKAITKINIAYEPIWAIGTGKPATAQAAQEIHFKLRKFIAEKWGDIVAEEIFILYGGSASESTAEDFSKQPDIDGLLIGGASLKLDSYSKIIQLVGAIQK